LRVSARTASITPQNADTVLEIGLEVLVLGDEDRIITDYQFILA
jgi:hypothetical protein